MIENQPERENHRSGGESVSL